MGGAYHTKIMADIVFYPAAKVLKYKATLYKGQLCIQNHVIIILDPTSLVLCGFVSKLVV